MANILVVYGTKYGQARKIAQAIGDELGRGGNQVTMLDAASRAHVEVARFDSVIVGGSVYAGRYPSSLRAWVKTNVSVLSRKDSAFYSVCLGILRKSDPKAQDDENRIVERFLAENGWNPRSRAIFAGGLPYTKYGWITRAIMKRISRKSGGDTDTSRDHEYTDWDEVKRFANEFASTLRRAA